MTIFTNTDIIQYIANTETNKNIYKKTVNHFKKSFQLFQSFHCNINHNYIEGLFADEENEIVYYSMDQDLTNFDINNSPCALIYQQEDTETSRLYYILLICTKRKMQNAGYASMLLKEFLEKITQSNTHNEKPTKILLSSLETAVTYYEKMGFKWKYTDKITDHEVLTNYEKVEDDKEYFIMEYVLPAQM